MTDEPRNQFTPEQLTGIAALESGEWAQGRGVLWRELDNGTRALCCLGVWSQLFAPRAKGMMKSKRWEGESRSAVAVPKVVKLMNLRDDKGQIVGPPLRGEDCLAGANDKGATFAEIANYCRKYPWSVFTNFDPPEDAK